MEWNVLTYAGHTVWGVHNEFKRGEGYKGGQKRRPRAEWIIQRDTHAALITDEEAEAILRQLETSTIGVAVSKAKSGLSDYLLTGLLRTPSGQLWTGNGGEHYRTKRDGNTPGRWLSMQQVDDAVIDLILRDMRAPALAEALARQARRHAAASGEDPAQELRREIVAINGQISKAMDLALQLEDPAPALRKVNELEAKRRAIADEVARLEREYTVQTALAHITDQQVTQILSAMGGGLRGATAGSVEAADSEADRQDRARSCHAGLPCPLPHRGRRQAINGVPKAMRWMGCIKGGFAVAPHCLIW